MALSTDALYSAFKRLNEEANSWYRGQLALTAYEKMLEVICATLDGKKNHDFELVSDKFDLWYRLYDDCGYCISDEDSEAYLERHMPYDNESRMAKIALSFPLGRAVYNSPSGRSIAVDGEDIDGNYERFEQIVSDMGEHRFKELLVCEDADYVDAFPRSSDVIADMVRSDPFEEDGTTIEVYEFISAKLGAFLLAKKRGVFDAEPKARMDAIEEAEERVKDPFGDSDLLECGLFKGVWHSIVILYTDSYTEAGPESLYPGWYAACLFLDRELTALNGKYRFYRGERKKKGRGGVSNGS